MIFSKFPISFSLNIVQILFYLLVKINFNDYCFDIFYYVLLLVIFDHNFELYSYYYLSFLLLIFIVIYFIIHLNSFDIY
jgi:hypothetical protein